MKTLVLTVEYPARASYYDDWRDAFLAHPGFQVTLRNAFDAEERQDVERTIRDYDLVVALHACTADSLLYAEPLTAALQNRRGRLVAFVGNELNSPWSPLGAKRDWLRRVEPDIVATQLLEEAGIWLYGDIAKRVISLPHALDPAAFRPERGWYERPTDIGGRSFRYPPFLGDDDRNRIYDFFRSHAFDPPLRVDLDTDSRFGRTGWAAFLGGCRATVSNEAGSWYLERDDRTVMEVRRHLLGRGGGLVIRGDSRLRRLSHKLPVGLKLRLARWLRRGPIRHEIAAVETADFAEIHARFFAGRPPAPVYGKCISSRHFDAIGTKTLQVMFPGRFNDILVAGEHYVPLARDFSNVREVVEVLRDPVEAGRIVDRAYEFALAGHTYRHRLVALRHALAA